MRGAWLLAVSSNTHPSRLTLFEEFDKKVTLWELALWIHPKHSCLSAKSAPALGLIHTKTTLIYSFSSRFQKWRKVFHHHNHHIVAVELSWGLFDIKAPKLFHGRSQVIRAYSPSLNICWHAAVKHPLLIYHPLVTEVSHLPGIVLRAGRCIL